MKECSQKGNQTKYGDKIRLPGNRKLVVRKRKPWRPTEEELRKSIFKEAEEMKDVTRRISSAIERAYSAGEKVAEEEGKTDTTKLILVGVLGLVSGILIAMSGLMPAP